MYEIILHRLHRGISAGGGGRECLGGNSLAVPSMRVSMGIWITSKFLFGGEVGAASSMALELELYCLPGSHQRCCLGPCFGIRLARRPLSGGGEVQNSIFSKASGLHSILRVAYGFFFS